MVVITLMLLKDIALVLIQLTMHLQSSFIAFGIVYIAYLQHP